MSKSAGERIGDDLYIYKGNHVTIIENFYDKKNKKNKEKYKIFGSHGKKILEAIFLIGIVLTAYYTSISLNKTLVLLSAYINQLISLPFTYMIS